MDSWNVFFSLPLIGMLTSVVDIDKRTGQAGSSSAPPRWPPTAAQGVDQPRGSQAELLTMSHVLTHLTAKVAMLVGGATYAWAPDLQHEPAQKLIN